MFKLTVIKKHLLRCLLLTSLLFGLALASPAWAEKISAYNVDITIQKSGQLAITEVIDYDFGNHSKHGIFRDIPFTIKYKSIVKNIGLANFSVLMDGAPVNLKELKQQSKHAGKVIRLKIGSPNKTITGKHRYTISYTVEKGVLPAAKDSNRDAIRWNVIGTGWNVPIENITADFHLPDIISQSNSTISTFTGPYGSTSTTASYKWIGDHHLRAYQTSLAPYEGMTVEIAYPANLLEQRGKENVKQSFFDKIIDNWHWAALLGFLAYFWREFKRYSGFTDKRAVAVQYEPPKGLSLLQSGLILDKSADTEDFAAAILELGSLGYLKIDQKDAKYSDVPVIGDFLTSKFNPPTLTRTNKSDKGLTEDQRYLLNKILFKGRKKITLTPHSESLAKDLKRGFNQINSELYDWTVKAGYMSENPKQVRTAFLTKSGFFIILFLILSGITLAMKYGPETIFILIFPVVFGGVGFSMFFSQGISGKLFGAIFASAGMIPLLALADKGLNLEKLLLGPVGILIALIAIMIFIYKRLGRFTPKGAYAQKQLLGLKDFISRVKKDELKRRLAEDPKYLEKLLPYAVLFGETKHWLSFFDQLNVETPTWYHGNPSGIQHFSSSVGSAATPPGSSGGGGFSGGGGSSGGGGGGGGGGSW